MKITEQAQVELKKALESFDKPGAGIHIYSAQGCCGPSIQMDIALQVGNGEKVYNIDTIDFFVTDALFAEMENVTIDYTPQGFRINGLKRSSKGCC